MPDQLYVPTYWDGTQHYKDVETSWPLPAEGSNGSFEPGSVLEQTGDEPLVLLGLDELLDELSERIFVAERVGGGARLVRETSWTPEVAARFALECASHVLDDKAAIKLPSGTSLNDVVDAARAWLDGATAEGALLGRFSRIGTARRLRRQGDEIGQLTLAMTVEDERRDLDALDDPAFARLAAVHDAVLAAVEALRHSAFPHLHSAEHSHHEADSPVLVQTPWGSVFVGRAAVPAWVAAGNAAERARHAAASVDAERVWQVASLAVALGEAEPSI